jgi:hypothetical protein
MGIHLPVKFSKDRIISLWEFGRTSSRIEKLLKGFQQNLAYILSRVGSIFWQKTNRKQMAGDKIGNISMLSNFNENWYLGLFWSEELIGNDENCIRGHFYSKTWVHRLRWGSTFLWSLVKIGSSVSENLVGQVQG